MLQVWFKNQSYKWMLQVCCSSNEVGYNLFVAGLIQTLVESKVRAMINLNLVLQDCYNLEVKICST